MVAAEDDRKFNKACRTLFKQGTDAKQLTDDAIEACKKQAIDPSELINRPVEDFYEVGAQKGKMTTE